MKKVPEISIGICTVKEITFSLNGIFADISGNLLTQGDYVASLSGERILIDGEGCHSGYEVEPVLSPHDIENQTFTIHSVTIGLNFHWQRSEDQTFRGKLRFIIEDGLLTAVNIIHIEDYLTSVISSEMSATSSPELLKAHAVVSRSWLLAQISGSRSGSSRTRSHISHYVTGDEIIKWYDREDHKNFDVCADDHCQRYQGITKASSEAVEIAIRETSGEVLTSEGNICDTRYYKCCGGVTEIFENVWEPVSHKYMQKVTDNHTDPSGFRMDLSNEGSAREWIMGNPEAFCNTSNSEILSQVLNDYDQETSDFFRWMVNYSQKELSDLIKAKSGIDFGIIDDLVPVERGVSGRIIRLKISGSLKTMTVGKELEIRKYLSGSHLYSSCFVVDKTFRNGETFFILHGAGWGHGVGLCQIGAAVMGARGYNYRDILKHYFKDSVLEKLY